MDIIRNMTSLCIGHVKVNDSGTYKLILENEHGKTTLNIKVKVVGRPSMPQNLHVENVKENSVTLKWTPPASDGGAKVKGYIIEKRDPFKRAYTHVGSTKSTDYKVMRLVEGQEYTFQVSAENDVGVSEPAELTQGVTAKSPYRKYCTSIDL
jgi:titin